MQSEIGLVVWLSIALIVCPVVYCSVFGRTTLAPFRPRNANPLLYIYYYYIKRLYRAGERR